MSWPDDFNRADGALGSNWGQLSGSGQIISNQAHFGTNAYYKAMQISEAGDQDHYIVAQVVNDAISQVDIYLKYDITLGRGYRCTFAYSSGTYTVQIVAFGFSPYAALATASESISPGSSLTFRATYSSGVVAAYIGSTQVCSAENSVCASYTDVAIGAGANGGDIDSFDTGGSLAASLTISPSDVYVAAPSSYFSVTLNDGVWAGPFPAAGTLSVNHGWLITQYEEANTRASFSYNALGYVGEVTVTDGETGATGTFLTRPYPVAGNGDSAPLTPDGAKVLNNADATCEDARVLTSCDQIEPDSGVTILKALDAILEQLSGFFGQIGADVGTDGRPANVHTPWYKDSTPSWYTVADMLSLLGGTPTLYSHADLRTDLSNAIGLVPTTIQGTDDHTIFDVMQQIAYLRTVNDYTLGTVDGWIDAAVDNIRGSGDPDIAAVITALGAIRTGSNYTLGDVMTAIAAIPAPDLSPVLDKLDTIQPSSTYNLSTITADVGDVGSTATTILSDLLTLTGDGEITLQMILDAITALANLVPKVPPVWPGADKVTFGDPAPFDENISLTEDMDGVVVLVTTPPTHTGRYLIGDATLDYGVGRIAFVDDSGHIEPWQYLGFRSALFTPKCMVRASGCKLQVLGGAEGTVTPWVMSEPAP